MCESHLPKQSKSRANIGAAFEGTAAAVDDKIRGPRKGTGPLLNVRQALFGGGAAVERGARDVASCKEGAKADIHDRGANVGDCRGKLADECGWLHDVSRMPGSVGTFLTLLSL